MAKRLGVRSKRIQREMQAMQEDGFPIEVTTFSKPFRRKEKLDKKSRSRRLKEQNLNNGFVEREDLNMNRPYRKERGF